MKLRTQKITALMAAAVLGISAFGSVPVTAAESTETADPGAAMMMDGEAVSSDLVAGTFKPSDVTCKAQDSYEYPFLGLKLSLSKELLKQIKDQSIAMLTTEDFENQTNAVTYAYVSWSKMTEEQKNAEIQKMGTGYDDWVAGLDRIGTIGVYDEASQKKLDEITGCTEHKELAEIWCSLPHDIYYKHREYDHKYKKDHIFQFSQKLISPKCPNLLWKRNLVQQILDQSKGAEKSAHQSSKQRSHKDQKSSYIICHFEVPASNHSLKRTNGAGPSCPGAGIAVQPRNTYIFQFSGVDLASYKP
jgi:hypothetical protein